MVEAATGRSSAGFSVILGAAALGLLLVPALAKASRCERQATPGLGEPVVGPAS